jgi:peroxiredoxin
LENKGENQMAENQKTEIGFPILGQKAPDFEAVTTQGTLRLSDYKGVWLVLFSHPADFTSLHNGVHCFF